MCFWEHIPILVLRWMEWPILRVVLLSKVALYAGREPSRQSGRHPARVSVPALSLLNKPEEQTQTYKAALEFFLCLISYFYSPLFTFGIWKGLDKCYREYFEKHLKMFKIYSIFKLIFLNNLKIFLSTPPNHFTF